MSTQLLINGQLEIFSQPVASWQFIPQSQLEINWGGGDIVTISGSTGTITKPFQNAPLMRYDGIIEILRSNNGQWVGQSGFFFLSSSSPQVELFPCNGTIWILISGTGFYRGDIAPMNYCGKIIRSFSSDSSPPSINSLSLSFNYVATSSFPDNPNFKYELSWWASGNVSPYTNIQKTVVTSSTEKISERWGNLNPSISTVTSGCILRVTFTNGTTQDLNYPTCPDVERVFNCPEACNIANRILTLLPQ